MWVKDAMRYIKYFEIVKNILLFDPAGEHERRACVKWKLC